MFQRNVHLYIATCQHKGIGIKAQGATASAALDTLVERYGQNRKGDDLVALTYIRYLANCVMKERRGKKDWSGTTVTEGRSFVKLVRI